MGAPSFKEDDGRDAGDAVFGGDFLRFVNVDLRDDGLASYSSATSSMNGAIILHGPHHVAKKSTRTELVVADRMRRNFQLWDVRLPWKLPPSNDLALY